MNQTKKANYTTADFAKAEKFAEFLRDKMQYTSRETRNKCQSKIKNLKQQELVPIEIVDTWTVKVHHHLSELPDDIWSTKKKRKKGNGNKNKIKS